jgi:hypothetical protein
MVLICGDFPTKDDDTIWILIIFACLLVFRDDEEMESGKGSKGFDSGM